MKYFETSLIQDREREVRQELAREIKSVRRYYRRTRDKLPDGLRYYGSDRGQAYWAILALRTVAKNLGLVRDLSRRGVLR